MDKLIKKRIKAYYDLASPKSLSDGKVWYQNAHQFAQELSEQYSIPLQQVCGILSALSPGVQWEVNKRQAESLIKARHYNTPALSDVTISTYRVQRNKAELLVKYVHTATEVIKVLGKESPKTKAFFWNIFRPTGKRSVTIDRWIMRAIGLPDERARRKLYKNIVMVFIELSGELSLPPNQLQAIVWLSIQENSELPDFIVEG